MIKLPSPNQDFFKKLFAEANVSRSAMALGVERATIYVWIKKGTWPRSEYLGETHYAEDLCELLGGKYTPENLLMHKLKVEKPAVKKEKK